MTLREKVGQLFMIGFGGTELSPELSSWLQEYQPGGIILFSRNLVDADQIAHLTNALQELVYNFSSSHGYRPRRREGFSFTEGIYHLSTGSYRCCLRISRLRLPNGRRYGSRITGSRIQHEYGSGIGCKYQPSQSYYWRSRV